MTNTNCTWHGYLFVQSLVNLFYHCMTNPTKWKTHTYMYQYGQPLSLIREPKLTGLSEWRILLHRVHNELIWLDLGLLVLWENLVLLHADQPVHSRSLSSTFIMGCFHLTFLYLQIFRILFGLILYVPVNNLSVMSGQVFLGWTSTKQGLMSC